MSKNSKLVHTGLLLFLLPFLNSCGLQPKMAPLPSGYSATTQTTQPENDDSEANPDGVVLPDASEADQKTLTNVVETSLIQNLNWPSSFSANDSGSRSAALAYDLRTDYKVFCEKPIISSPSHSFLQGPRIRRFSNESGVPSLETLFEFPNEYFNDFDGGFNQLLSPEGSAAVSHTLTINTVLMEDNSVIVSSNVSNKLFRVNSSGALEVFLENDELMGISDMILGSDGKIYLAQVSLNDCQDKNRIVREKRVLSIDANKNIAVEFSLPGSESGFDQILNESTNASYAGACLPFVNQITIVENSKEGKQINDPSKFYVSDMFQNVIYKISESNEVSVLAKDIGYPNSLVVDYWGRVLFTTTPLKSSNDYLITQPQLIAINPKTGVHKALFSFNMSYDDADTGLGYILSADERGTISLPISFRIDAVLYDDLKNFEYVFVNNHAGKLENLSGKLE